jgi:hypothetical protein
MEPRGSLLASVPKTCVENNVNSLMNVDDEKLWEDEGLFDLVDTASKAIASTQKNSTSPLPKPRPSPCLPSSPSLAKPLLPSTSFSVPLVRSTAPQYSVPSFEHRISRFQP